MKKLIALIIVVVIFCGVLGCFCSCYSSEMIQYYAQKENYICVTGTISSMKYNEDFTALYIGFSETSPVLDDTSFKIVGENLAIVRANQIDDKLRVGDQITFITAPKYYGDGYVMPIVAVLVKGEDLLKFEEGHQNFLDWLRSGD